METILSVRQANRQQSTMFERRDETWSVWCGVYSCYSSAVCQEECLSVLSDRQSEDRWNKHSFNAKDNSSWSLKNNNMADRQPLRQPGEITRQMVLSGTLLQCSALLLNRDQSWSKVGCHLGCTLILTIFASLLRQSGQLCLRISECIMSFWSNTLPSYVLYGQYIWHQNNPTTIVVSEPPPPPALPCSVVFL